MRKRLLQLVHIGKVSWEWTMRRIEVYYLNNSTKILRKI